MLNSNSWANSSRGLPKNQINWNQFGFRVGGPVVIPGLYDGHNKAFYFVNYEEFRLPITSSTTRQYVSPAAAGGLFQYGCTAAGCASSRNLLQAIGTAAPRSIRRWRRCCRRSMPSTLTQGAIQTNVDRNTLALHVAAEPVPRRAPAGRTARRQPDRQAPPDGDAGLPEGELGSRHHQQRLSELPGVRGGQHAVLVPLHRHGVDALDAESKNMVNEGGWGTIWSPVYFSANITPDRYFGGYNLTFPALPTGGTTLTPFNVTATATIAQRLELQLPRHAELAEGTGTACRSAASTPRSPTSSSRTASSRGCRSASTRPTIRRRACSRRRTSRAQPPTI